MDMKWAVGPRIDLNVQQRGDFWFHQVSLPVEHELTPAFLAAVAETAKKLADTYRDLERTGVVLPEEIGRVIEHLNEVERQVVKALNREF